MLTIRHVPRLASVTMLSVTALALSGGPAAIAQERSASIYKNARVANFVAAERMDGDHPAVKLSFWSGPHGQVIEYDPGRGLGPVELHPIRRTVDKQALRVRAPDGAIWTVTPSKGVLLLHGGSPRPRVFLWQYQGPVEGRGTACRPCIPEEDALRFVTDEFVAAAR